jgi:hypothetical protein
MPTKGGDEMADENRSGSERKPTLAESLLARGARLEQKKGVTVIIRAGGRPAEQPGATDGADARAEDGSGQTSAEPPDSA